MLGLPLISDPVEYPYLMVRKAGEAEGAGERGEKCDRFSVNSLTLLSKMFIFLLPPSQL